MKQKDKELLLKDLCARLPYGVIIEGLEHPEIMNIRELAIISVMPAEPYKPYLRPMSSMTEEEKKKFDDFCVIDEFVFAGKSEIGHKNQAIIMSDGIDYLNSIHVDYRGLIPMGLAIEVTKENNPYKE